MYPFSKRILMSMVLAFGAREALAAEHMVPESGAIRLMLLRQKSVREELKLSEDQTNKIRDFSGEQWKKAKALAEKRPVVLVISTPTYCESQFCGPVTEMVGDLAKSYANRARFVHIEVWKDYQAKQLNDAAKEWIARGEDINEPWVFLIGADGKISARFDNVVTRGELEPLIQKLPPMKA